MKNFSFVPTINDKRTTLNRTFTVHRSPFLTPLSILTVFCLFLSQNAIAQSTHVHTSSGGKNKSYSSTASSKTSSSTSVHYDSDNGSTSYSSHTPHTPNTPHTNDRSSKAVRKLFQRLVADGKMSLNQKVKIRFDNDLLKIDGKVIDDATFDAYKKYFQSHLEEGKYEYEIKFEGVITKISDNGMDLSGSMSTSFSKDDD